MKSNTEFHHFPDEVICTYQKGETRTCGSSKCHPDDEKYKNKMTGETIAYYRAIEKYYKSKLVALNKEIKMTKNIYTYVFPSKLVGQGVDIVKYRFDNYIKMKEKEKESYKNAIISVRKTCENYIEGKQKIHKRIEENKTV